MRSLRSGCSGSGRAFMASYEPDDALLAALTEAARSAVHGLIESGHWAAAAAIFLKAAAIFGGRAPAGSAAPFGLAALDLLLNGIGNSFADFDSHRREYVEIYT